MHERLGDMGVTHPSGQESLDLSIWIGELCSSIRPAVAPTSGIACSDSCQIRLTTVDPRNPLGCG
jgi:hypothetical protein